MFRIQRLYKWQRAVDHSGSPKYCNIKNHFSVANRYKNPKIDRRHQGGNERGTKNHKESAENSGETVKCYVGRPSGDGRRGEGTGRKRADYKSTPLEDRIHGHPWDENHGTFGQVGDVPRVLSKADVPTGDFGLQVTLNRSHFLDIPDTLMCRGRKMNIIV